MSDILPDAGQEIRKIRRYSLLALVIWSLLFAGAFTYFEALNANSALVLARETALANINRDTALRAWVSNHGGVFVPRANAEPNPYLPLSQRTDETVSGQSLTRMNPAYVLRDFYSHYSDDLGIRSRLVGRSPINPENTGDDWERDRLQMMVSSDRVQYFEVTDIDGRPFLRGVQRLQLEPSCRECHQAVSDHRQHLGAISVSVPMQTILAQQEATTRPVYLGSGVIWFCGVGIILLLSELTQRRISEREESERKLRRAATVFTSSHEGIVVASLKGEVLAVNPAFTSITGYPEAEILGRNLSLLQSGHHDKTFYKQLWQSISEKGYWRGEIWNRRRSGEVYPEWLTISAVKDAAGKVANYVGVFSDISLIKQSQEQLEYLAYHDPLTGLPNRAMLKDRLDHAVERLHRSGAHGAVMFMDLDRFKAVNDSYGHPVGDEVLKSVAQRLAGRLREGDTLARLGGDEFVVLLEDLESPESVAVVARDLITLFNQLFDIGEDRQVSLGLSIGICLFPEDAEHTDDILQHADAALYQAKQAGRNTYRFYTEALTQAAREKLSLESSLRMAIERDQLVLHYQPLLDLQTRKIIGVEALVRWDSPEHGFISPGTFIPLAEETGLIVPLGEWVMREACGQMRAWLDQGLELGTVAVNLSPVQFRHEDLLGMVRSALEESRLDPRYVELEITESGLMDNIEAVELRIDRLKAMGLRMSIDDFGTGYSSMAYLQRFSIDKLKIDQSFTRAIEENRLEQPLVTTIVSLARSLKLQVLAEGIETEVQLNYLRALGCDLGQGYLFSRPLPAQEITRLLQQSQTI
jgi:diguanylate cyclase (GGDEF)-like protein/PAS domain S-box-containing protein